MHKIKRQNNKKKNYNNNNNIEIWMCIRNCNQNGKRVDVRVDVLWIFSRFLPSFFLYSSPSQTLCVGETPFLVFRKTKENDDDDDDDERSELYI